jgi:hypothetical protein
MHITFLFLGLLAVALLMGDDESTHPPTNVYYRLIIFFILYGFALIVWQTENGWKWLEPDFLKFAGFTLLLFVLLYFYIVSTFERWRMHASRK